MEALTDAGPWAILVTVSLVLGAIAAATVKVPSRLAALLTAGGGGLLLAAVAFELVPEAGEQAGPLLTVAGLLAGAVLYVAADAALVRHEGLTQMRQAARESAVGMPVSETTMARASVARGEAIAAGIVVDGIPESIALGLMAVEGAPGLALLVAVVIGNLTESYGAAQPIIHGGRSRRFAVGLLAAIGLGLGATTMLGGLAGGALPGSVIGTAQALAGGAVVAVLSISILPYAFDEADRKVALATVAGLAAGYLLSA